MNKKMTIILACLFLTTGLLQAMPPREGIVLDKEQLELMQKLGIDSPRDGILQRESKLGRTKISGNRNYPVISGDFTDTVHIYANTAMQSNLFNAGTGLKTVNNYYRDMSYNAMSCSGSVFNWVSSGNTRAYFGNNAGGMTDGTIKNAYEFIVKTLQACDAAVNFADPKFDSNNDDTVDVLWVIHAGRGREETLLNADIHSHSFWLTGFTGGVPYVTGDVNSRGKNVRINKYIIMPEKTKYGDGNSGTVEIIGVGVFCHEFGHALGLPDLYDTGDQGPGIGNWSVMAGGSWGGNGSTNATPSQMDVWCKRFLGWIVPFNVTQNGPYNFNASLSDSHRTTARISKLGLLTNTQFWLIEDRRAAATGPVSGVAWDQYIYSSGLAIYHIDSTYTTTTYLNANTVNASNTRPYGVSVEETDQNSAGYASELYSGTNPGDAADMWNSTNQANFDSTGTAYPCTFLNGANSTTSGGNSGTAVRKIPAAGKGGDMSKAMLCTLYVIPAGPMGVNLSQFTAISGQNGITLNWRTESEMGSLTWEVERCAGASEEYQTVKSLPAYGTTNSVHDYSYTDDSPELVSGLYYYRLVQIDASGEENYFGPVEANYVQPGPAALEYALLPCHPNPAKQSTTIDYQLSKPGYTSLKVYNLLGLEVNTLAEGWKEAGMHTAAWNGKDRKGQISANGIYFYKLVSGNFTATQKITILR